jgi:hypothetical protein
MATSSICSERRCGNAAVVDGRCRYHIMAHRRAQRPRKSRPEPRPPGWTRHNNGRSRKWIEAHAGWQGDDCLIWPFSRDAHGYGQLASDRTVRRAHRVMCEIAHGPKPAPGFVAAHTCGKGREGCVNPRHLRWASQKENMADKLLHGTSNRTASMQQNFEVHVLCATCGRAADDWQPKRSGKGVMLVVSCHGSTQLLPLPVGSAVLAFDVPLAKRTG